MLFESLETERVYRVGREGGRVEGWKAGMQAGWKEGGWKRRKRVGTWKLLGRQLEVG